MKHLKTFETLYPKSSVLLPEYDGLVYIDRPSETYFKSSIRFTLVFVDKVYKEVYEGDFNSNQYRIEANVTFQRSEYSRGDSYSVNKWDQSYAEDEFKRIKFMTPSDFYYLYKDTFLRILDIIFEKIDNKRINSEYKATFEQLLDKMSIPEIQHILNSRKYNL